ncbi:MAG TPA: hypothetical protein PKN52_04690 [Trueperaceae bacterium]|nr:hypothetical protein [Trueperaceae bacterium]
MEAKHGEATVAGRRGMLVTDERVGLVWEAAVTVDEFRGLVEFCGLGNLLEVAGVSGAFKAMARRWWVLPMGDEMLVRIGLERVAAA